jgi:hypothetical protein
VGGVEEGVRFANTHPKNDEAVLRMGHPHLGDARGCKFSTALRFGRNDKVGGGVEESVRFANAMFENPGSSGGSGQAAGSWIWASLSGYGGPSPRSRMTTKNEQRLGQKQQKTRIPFGNDKEEKRQKSRYDRCAGHYRRKPWNL